MPEIEPGRRERMLAESRPQIVQGITQRYHRQSFRGEPTSRRQGAQCKAESDIADLAEAACELGILAVKAEIGIEAAGGIEGAL
jgi:hypothetical protein